MEKQDSSDIVIYQTKDGLTKIDVRFQDKTVWLSQQQMALLYQSSRTNIVEHIQHIYEEGELDEGSNCRHQAGNQRNSILQSGYDYLSGLPCIIPGGYSVQALDY